MDESNYICGIDWEKVLTLYFYDIWFYDIRMDLNWILSDARCNVFR